MTDDAIWDRELTASEWNNIKRNYGPIRIETSLKRKVEILESWVENGVPGAINWISHAGSRTKLREWHDPSLKLWPWSDDAPEKRASNKPLIDRWKVAKNELGRKRRQSPAENLAYLKQKTDALEAQVLALLADKAWLEDELLKAKSKRPPKKSETLTL
jgi:hypothetical protein